MFEKFYKSYEKLIKAMDLDGFEDWRKTALEDTKNILKKNESANTERWMKAFNNLPEIKTSKPEFKDGSVVFENQETNQVDKTELKDALMGLHPWRKGPYYLNGVHIETEWRSNMKWDRLIPYIKPLKNKAVLDIGCGSGYHMWRMREAGASFVLGIEPFLLNVIQFETIKKFAPEEPVFLLPFGIENLPKKLEAFDTVFSMGILYHRRSPIDHLKELSDLLKKEGELVLETLIIEGEEGEVLVPEDRYASMRNVWFLPSVPELEKWMRRSGFKNIRCVDINKTTEEEQRRTEWMKFYSLAESLDPNDKEKTIEGYPAPKRAIIIADKK